MAQTGSQAKGTYRLMNSRAGSLSKLPTTKSEHRYISLHCVVVLPPGRIRFCKNPLAPQEKKLTRAERRCLKKNEKSHDDPLRDQRISCNHFADLCEIRKDENEEKNRTKKGGIERRHERREGRV